MTLAKGTTATLKRDEATNWHNVAGYPQVTVTENTRVWIVSGPNPYVTVHGTFYLVQTRQGDDKSIVAIDSANLKPIKPERFKASIPEKLTHYIAMSGAHGCLPDSCNAYETYQAAVDTLADLFELGRTRKARLFTDRYLELKPVDGAEYCEIVACQCTEPWSHCDAGPDPRDWKEYTRPEAESGNLLRVSCDQCQMLSINGIACHETGCPNMGARWEHESQLWIKQRKCFDCGCTVDADDPCCSAPCED
jgi:hypothetical protein